jgi:hypothetical protein
MPRLPQSRALWNRDKLDLRSEETIAQILDRGTIEDWRELYARAAEDSGLRARIAGVVRRVPLPFPHFWIAALRTLGEPIEHDARLPYDDGCA